MFKKCFIVAGSPALRGVRADCDFVNCTSWPADTQCEEVHGPRCFRICTGTQDAECQKIYRPGSI